MYHRPSLSETAPCLRDASVISYNHFCDAAARYMPNMDACRPCQWHDPAWVHDLVYDAAWRIPSDDFGEFDNSFPVCNDLYNLVQRTFYCFTEYQTCWFIEQLYRHMGRYCVDTPTEIPRDQCNYMKFADTLCSEMRNVIRNYVTMGTESVALENTIRAAYLYHEPEMIRLCIQSGGFDEQSMAEYEDTARKKMQGVLEVFNLFVTNMRYTAIWSADGKCKYHFTISMSPKQR